MKCAALSQTVPAGQLARAHRVVGRIDEISLDGLIRLAGAC